MYEIPLFSRNIPMCSPSAIISHPLFNIACVGRTSWYIWTPVEYSSNLTINLGMDTMTTPVHKGAGGAGENIDI